MCRNGGPPADLFAAATGLALDPYFSAPEDDVAAENVDYRRRRDDD